MDAKLFLVQLLAKGEVIPENAYRVEVCTDMVYFYTENSFEYQDWSGNTRSTTMLRDGHISFDNEQVGYESYTLEFTNDEFTVAEFNEFLAQNPNIVETMKENQREGVKRLRLLSEVISDALEEGEEIAKELGLPFMVNLGGSQQDVRKLAAVDWDSSSMYC